MSLSKFCIIALVVFLSSCGTAPSVAYHGFTDQGTLNQKDDYVLAQSAGGALDPNNLTEPEARYEHDNIAYSRVEEGYYQWGKKLYGMGYRDVYYVRDLAPRAFRHEMMDVYDHAVAKGFEDAADTDKSSKK